MVSSSSLFDPSYDLFQRLSLDESLRRTISVYCAGLVVFTQIASLIVLLNAIIWTVLLIVLLKPIFNIDNGSDFTDPTYMVEHIGAFNALMLIKMVIGMMIGAVGNGAMIRAVADIYLKRQPNLKDCLLVGFQRGCTILTASFLGIIGISIGSLLLFVPGIYLAVVWFAVNPVIVIEGYGLCSAFRRSMNLVSGSWCYVFCTVMIVFIITMIIQMVWSAVVVGGNDAGHTLFSIYGSIVAIMPTIITGPSLGILMTIMYINLRIEKEGLNADLLARNLGESGGRNGGIETYSPLVNDDDDEVTAQLTSV